MHDERFTPVGSAYEADIGRITKTLGMRSFWDMKQNQDMHKDAAWQDKMVEIYWTTVEGMQGIPTEY